MENLLKWTSVPSPLSFSSGNKESDFAYSEKVQNTPSTKSTTHIYQSALAATFLSIPLLHLRRLYLLDIITTHMNYFGTSHRLKLLMQNHSTLTWLVGDRVGWDYVFEAYSRARRTLCLDSVLNDTASQIDPSTDSLFCCCYWLQTHFKLTATEIGSQASKQTDRQRDRQKYQYIASLPNTITTVFSKDIMVSRLRRGPELCRDILMVLWRT